MDNKQKSKKYYDEINIARGIAVILVLWGHAFPDVLSESNILYHKIMYHIIYSFHMGLFFVLSGFVSSRKIVAGNMNIKNELFNKIKRLIVPYLFYSFITMGLKQIFSAFAYNSFDITEFWKILLGKNPNGGLWYLWTLFVVSMLCYLLSKFKLNSYFYVVIGVFFYLLLYFVPQGFYSNILKYFVFYALGIVIAKSYDSIKKVISSNLTAIISAILFAVLLCIKGVPYAITGILGTAIVMYLSIKISNNKESKVFRFFNETGNYSYDIYLISYFVQIPIRVIFDSILNMPYYFVVILMLVLGGIIPYFVCKYIIRKIPIANKILLGNWK